MIVLDSTQEEALFSSFLKMAQAKDGDFEILEYLGQATSDLESLDLVIQELKKTPHSNRALEQHLQIGPIDLTLLAQMPQESLGYQYYQHLSDNNLKPLIPTECQTTYQYLNYHLSETHDLQYLDLHRIGERGVVS